MYKIETTNRFEKDILLAKKQKRGIAELAHVLNLLEKGEQIPEKYQNHKLKNIKPATWDLHVEPDWVLLYIKDDKNKIIKLVRIGSHSELFK